MKANELMVGDIIAVNNTPLQIAALGTVKAGFIDAKGEMFYHYYDNIAPIPLTRDILEKNGWKYNEIIDELGVERYYTNEKAEMDIHIQEHGVLEIRVVDSRNIILKYVHELQHALKLYGINKTIKL